jgi:hypothetical protein
MVVLICEDCGHATDVKDDAFAEELLQLEVFHGPCKAIGGKGVMRKSEPFKHIAEASVRPLHSESTSEDNNILVDLDMPGLFKELLGRLDKRFSGDYTRRFEQIKKERRSLVTDPHHILSTAVGLQLINEAVETRQNDCHKGGKAW